MIGRRGFLLAAAGLALAGCGAAPDAAPVVETFVPAPSSAVPVPVAPSAKPVEVRIPDLGITSALVGLGLAADGTAAVPPSSEPHVTTWFEPGVKPGDPGPAVILGHRSGRPDGASESVPGVFARLDELQPGAPIQVLREDGSTAWFLVRAVETHDKDAFPTQRVFGDVAKPELRLITCSGDFDQAARSYSDNLIVFADLMGIGEESE